MDMLYEGAIIAVIVVFLFLMEWHSTVRAAIALPLSIIPTFLVMDYLGYSLNTVTLLALSLVVGILVDDSIVEVENIERHMQMGKPVDEASMEAADEIGLAVIATSFTLIAVFMPTAYMGGVIGIIFKQFGITALVAVCFSLLVARLITPMMAAYMMKAKPEAEKPDGVIMRSYLTLMRGALRRRWIPVLGHLSTGFFPASDSSQTQVNVTTAPGTTFAETDAVSRRVSDAVVGVDHVLAVFQATGSASNGGSATSSVTAATIVVDLTNIEDCNVSQTDIEESIRSAVQNIPGARIAVGSGGNGTELQISMAGDNSDTLEQAASSLEEDVRANIQGIGIVTSSVSIQSPEIVITPDLAVAASYDVTS